MNEIEQNTKLGKNHKKEDENNKHRTSTRLGYPPQGTIRQEREYCLSVQSINQPIDQSTSLMASHRISLIRIHGQKFRRRLSIQNVMLYDEDQVEKDGQQT